MIALTDDDKRLVVSDYFLNEDDFGKVHFEGDHHVRVIRSPGITSHSIDALTSISTPRSRRAGASSRGCDEVEWLCAGHKPFDQPVVNLDFRGKSPPDADDFTRNMAEEGRSASACWHAPFCHWGLKTCLDWQYCQ